MVDVLAIAVPLFAVTNIDGFFVLVGFLSDHRYKVGQVVAGQFVGIALLVGFSIAASLIALIIPSSYIGLLGLCPIAVGVAKLIHLRHDTNGLCEQYQAPSGGVVHRSFAVAAVTIANGGDNVSVYTAFFAVRSSLEISFAVATFAVMTGLWCFLAYSLVNHQTLGKPIRQYARTVLPVILIALGCFVLYDSRTLALFGM